MTAEFKSSYAASVATLDLVDRVEILDIVQSALADSKSRLKVIYITAEGGWGKTRLLEEIRQFANGEKPRDGWRFASLRIPSRLVDLYHSQFHSIDGLIHEVVEALDEASPTGGNFLHYRNAWNAYYVGKQMYLSNENININELREQFIEAFITDYLELEKRKVLLLVDTAETIVPIPSEISTVLEETPKTVRSWLTDSFLPRLQNSVVIIAGRPESAAFRDELHHRLSDERFIAYELPAFNEDDSLKYFDEVARTAKYLDKLKSERIADISANQRRVIHRLFNGHPLGLALMIDHVGIGNRVTLQARISPGEAEKRWKDEIVRLADQERAMQAILTSFMELDHPLDDILFLISLAPKGVNPELLAWMHKLGRPNEDEIAAAKKILDRLGSASRNQRISFIKTRPSGHVFLQDVMYEMFEAARPSRSQEYYRRLYESIDRYYYSELEKLAEQVTGSSAQEGLALSATDPAGVNASFQAHARRRSLMVEKFAYALIRNPTEGLQCFGDTTDQAVDANDQDLISELSDELLRFHEKHRQTGYDRYPVEQRLTDEMVHSRIVIELIKQDTRQGRYGQALTKAKRIREKHKDWLEPDDLARLYLLILEAEASGYTKKEDIGKAFANLVEVFFTLDRIEARSGKDNYTRSLRARAHNTRGYLHRTCGDYKAASQEYTEANEIWRELRNDAEMANSLNNLGWAKAELGQFWDAERYIDDALNIRKHRGLDYAFALGLNTRALMLTRMGYPREAAEYSEMALQIMIGLTPKPLRGIGLVKTAIAEAYRRSTEPRYYLPQVRKIELLREAEQAAIEARDIFDKQVHEPLRLTEAEMELGLVYRELARLDVVEEDKRKYAQQAEKRLRAAVTSSASDLLDYRAVDALVNLAYHKYYQGDSVAALAVLDQEVGQLIPAKYKLDVGDSENTRFPCQFLDEEKSWFWVQLGKAYLLRGRIHFDKFRSLDHQAKLARDANESSRMETLRTQSHPELADAASEFTLAMAYNRNYSSYFRDLKKAENRLYDLLAKLNRVEWDVVREAACDTVERYQIPESHRLFEEIIERHFYYPFWKKPTS